MKHIFITLTLVCILTNAVQAQAVAIPGIPAQKGLINDNENDFDLATIAYLTKAVDAHKTKTGNQIVVVTVASFAPSTSLGGYAKAVADRWEVGGYKKMGVTVVFSQAKGEVYINIGAGVTAKLTEDMAQKIIQQKMLPKFSEGNVDQGIIDGVAEIIRVLEAK